MSRKKVVIEENYHYSLDRQPLTDIISDLQRIVDEHSELENIRMDVEIDYEWDSAYIKAEIYGYRREKTKEELVEEQQAEEDRIKSRIENIEKMKQNAEEELQKLKGEII